MLLTKKIVNFIAVALMVVGVGCGEGVPVAQPHAVADKGYLLSFTRLNLDGGESRYHFQLCRQQVMADMGAGNREVELGVGERVCFNPFEDVEGEPLVFAALPAMDNLWMEGMAGKTLRYLAGTAAVLVLGSVAFVLIPKAARLAFTKMLQLRSASLSQETDEVIAYIAQKSADKAQSRAFKKGKDFGRQQYRQHYEQVLKKKTADFSIFKTKPALFFTSLFIVGGTIGGWKFSYESWRGISKQLKAWGWGERELELAGAYPFLTSVASEPYRVASVKQLLETLRDHQQLIFSAAYLREFPPAVTDATDRNMLNKNF